MIDMLKAGGGRDEAQAGRGERRTGLQHKSEDRVRKRGGGTETVRNEGKKSSHGHLK